MQGERIGKMRPVINIHPTLEEQLRDRQPAAFQTCKYSPGTDVCLGRYARSGILQISSVTLFEKTSIFQALSNINRTYAPPPLEKNIGQIQHVAIVA